MAACRGKGKHGVGVGDRAGHGRSINAICNVQLSGDELIGQDQTGIGFGSGADGSPQYGQQFRLAVCLAAQHQTIHRPPTSRNFRSSENFYGRGGGVDSGLGVGLGWGVPVGVGVGLGGGVPVTAAPSITYCDWLGMPLVKTVTSAWPMGKPLEWAVITVIGVEVNEVSDQPVLASTSSKSVCSLARLNSWTSG